MKPRWLAGAMTATILISTFAARAQAENLPVPQPLSCAAQPDAVTVAAIGFCVAELRTTVEMILGGALPAPDPQPESVCALDPARLTPEAVGACLTSVRADTAPDTPIGGVFQQIDGWIAGNTGRGLATIGITVIGIGALLGKVSWGMALAVGIAMALAFGADVFDAILKFLTPSRPQVSLTKLS